MKTPKSTPPKAAKAATIATPVTLLSYEETALKLVALYNEPFGGKPMGRFRIATKLVRDMMGRKRIYDTDSQALARAVFDLGFVLIDMDGFFVLLKANTFVNYRRANADSIAD